MTQHLVVIGLGYVGLPLVQQSIASGLHVTGLDVNKAVVDQLNAGVSHVDDLSDDEVARMLELGFKATTDPSVLASADVAVICVPTPLSPQGGPDLAAVESATGLVAEHLHEEMLVVLESTTYPGTTEEIVKPALEEASGLVCGRDFNLAFSPERVDPGNPSYGIGNTPKVVGGVTSRCTERARDFYARFVDTVVPARGTREAEMAKLLENTYRHINIALVNEMARFCHELEIDLWDVIGCASTKPFGFQPFYPGPGVGGHCIPIDPNYLSYQVNQKLGYPFRFVELAEEINSSMPVYVAQRLRDLLKEEDKSIENSRILLLGVTYKPNIGDQRESPAVPLARELEAWGATVEFHDPFVEKWGLPDRTVDRVEDLERALREADVTALLQNHSDYDLDFIGATARRLFDTRGVVRADGISRL
jgi:UDP-N-acetyl-D-glucosamine dehydrogenase